MSEVLIPNWALYSTILQLYSGKATEYDSKSGEYLVEVGDGTSIWARPTELSKPNDGLADFEDTSSDEDDDEAGGGGVCDKVYHLQLLFPFGH